MTEPTPPPVRNRRPPREAFLPRSLTRETVLRLSLLTTAGMTLVALIILLFRGTTLREVLFAGMPVGTQILLGTMIGVGAGVVLGLVGWLLPGFEKMHDITRDAFRQLRPRTRDLAAVSAGAGWGEELLFRGAIQPLIGIWPAAVLFALAHGLLTRLTPGRVGYTLALVAAGAGLGYLAEWAGLLAAIVAHGVYDFVALVLARRLLKAG